ncbi:MAG TPA: GvpL/GvpF family gas vesicle protein [Candidatus Saccharimonadales bacterium]|nr:GvpL/GvpF family gas vesicle protein [Candidatus Saccharimonadales bacterium]
MAWYAYCISEQANFQQGRVRRPFLIESLKGVNASPVRGFPCGEFVVIVSEIEHGQALTQQSAMEHARIVSECFKVATLLPFKFGTVFESDEALRQAIRNNKRTFADSIAKLRGKSEMHIRVTVREGTAIAELLMKEVPHKAGGEYLSRLKVQASRDRERQSRARALSVQVSKLLNPLQEEISCKKVETGIVLDIAHLINSDTVEKYQSRYSSALRQFKDVEITLSGPWPPYHFMPDPGKVRTVVNN